MDDSVSRIFISILAAHTYKPLDQSIPYRKALEYGKSQWQTEVSDLNPIDRSMDNALRWVQEIHTMLTRTRINAWHYWLLDGATKNNNEGLWSQGSTTRLYAFGNYAKFARPGFVVLGTTSSSADILVTAFKDTAASEKIAIVAANRSAVEVSCTFTLNQSRVKTLTPWETSSRSDLARSADILMKDGRFTIKLPAKSVTTFDGAEPATVRISIRPAEARMPGAENGNRILGMGMISLDGIAWGADRAVRLDGRAPERSAVPKIPPANP